MDIYKRHRRTWRILYALIRRPLCARFRLTHEDLDAEGPILLISNHVSAWDPLLVAMSLPRKQVYYVASEHLFRLGPVTALLNWLVAPIPRRKASAGTDTVRACLRHFREGRSVCLFAEGEQCWDGRNSPIFPATGKLARTGGVTLVTFRLEGAYLSLPRWGKGVRRGAVRGGPVGVYPPEQLKKMTPQEINALIERDISENAWERQRPAPVRYRGKRLAEGMERALYACPGCRKIGTLRTEDDRIFCPCGFERVYEETGFFSPSEPFENLAEWDDWQRMLLRERGFPHAGELLFSDEGVELTEIFTDHSEKSLGRDELRQYEDRIACGEWSVPLSDIDSMAMVQAHLLLLSAQGRYYQLRVRGRENLRKYLEIWKER